MKYDFLEIGTSDFCTEIETSKDYQRGISIDAVSYYIDRLPNKENIVKHHLAISNSVGTSTISYVNPEVVQSLMKLDNGDHMWIKGCSAIDHEHPMIQTYLTINNLTRDDMVKSETVQRTTLYSVFLQDNVTGLYYLKIDTEGHDVIILRQFLEDVVAVPTLLPHRIQFESNTNIPVEDVDEILETLLRRGYILHSRGEDTVLRLYLPRHDASMFSVGFDNYYIPGYPSNYNPRAMPHDNTLESAKAYCKRHNLSGVTLQDRRYEVRSGQSLVPVPESMVGTGITSWTFV